MSQENEYIHLRVPKVISDIINKMSFDSGMSKQDICRHMIFSMIEKKYNLNPVTELDKLKKEISNEKTNFITT